jgi:hypothetical protein
LFRIGSEPSLFVLKREPEYPRYEENFQDHPLKDLQSVEQARKLAANRTYNSDTKLQPLYRTLIECMANTKKHANGKNEKDETWWLAVFNNDETKLHHFRS